MRSAVANANQKPDVDVDALFVKNILVDQGATLKRFRPRAQGRAYRILKRMSHITVILSEKA
jgi:large subunit ribosomal protein L22